MARQCLDANGLTQWGVRLDRAKRRAGCCHYRAKELSFSAALGQLYTRQQMQEVVWHEVAHALAGPRAGHGPKWKRTVVSLGGTPRRTLDPQAAQVPPKWVGVCPNGHTVGRLRRPRVEQSCYECSHRFDRRFLLVWQQVGD